MGIRTHQMLVWVSAMMCLIGASLEFDPVDNYLIDCGSTNDTSVGDRVFLADNSSSTLLSTPQRILVSASSNSISSTHGSALYQTARVFRETSKYNFSIRDHGRHWIRLYFFPFDDKNFNLSTAKFSIYAGNFTLVKNFQPPSTPVVKEYALNTTTDYLVITFEPAGNSVAFLNALEVISLPDQLLPSGAGTDDPSGKYQDLTARALETVARVNMGNETVFPENDTLWRNWARDGDRYLSNSNLVQFVENTSAVHYIQGGPSPDIAPVSVYETATMLHSILDPSTLINVTWSFVLDSDFDYFIRFHFCDIVVGPSDDLVFNVFINSLYAYKDLDLGNKSSNVFGSPIFVDAITRLDKTSNLKISIGPSAHGSYPSGILNGLEIMKISNSKASLDAADAEILSSESASRTKLWLILGSSVGAFIVIVLLVSVWLLVHKSRWRALVDHSVDDYNTTGEHTESKYSEETSIISRPNMGYRFPFHVVQEATDNFSESLVIGIGGFGKVYKGVLNDNTKVAVKRGISDSPQGLVEFRTEIEMISQFRHRHLVSLIGYCDQKGEMIIIFEYMENGALKDHLYGSDLPKLNWRQRLEICIGSARGLHYLHTGSDNAIIHRDVKSANILLDENLRAKVADFGLSKIGPEIDQTHVSTAVKGSFGYLDPEYLTRQQLTEKSDVYSFGVVMLEILSGRPVIDPSLPRGMVNLVEWVTKFLKNGELEMIVDPCLADEVKPESLRKFAETAEKCLAECGIDRPTMGDVLWNLEYALRLQGGDGIHPRENGDSLDDLSRTGVSSTQFSMGSMGDLAGISMSKVFSEMVKAEMR